MEIKSKFISLNQFTRRVIILAVLLIITSIIFINYTLKDIQQRELSSYRYHLNKIISQNLTPNLKLGLNTEVYQECKKLVAENVINSITIVNYENEIICQVRSSSSSKSTDFMKREIYFDNSRKDLLAIITTGYIAKGFEQSNYLYLNLISFFLIISLFVFTIFRLSKTQLTDPLLSLVRSNKKENKNMTEIKSLSFKIKELHTLRESIVDRIQGIIEIDDKEKKIEALEARGKLAKQVAHDIQSPLAALETLVQQDTGNQILSIVTNRIKSILSDLQSSTYVPLKDKCISEIISEILNEKRLEYKSSEDLQFNHTVDLTKETYLTVPERDIKRIISNIINNSIEAQSYKGIITITLTKLEQEVLISIKDQGSGIPKEIESKIFEKDFSFGKENHKRSGSGIGLFHAKQTLEKFNSEIYFETSKGIGTTFFLKIPIN
jgi:signal transduction histidine kinase